MIIDKKEPGANAAYGYRIIFEETINQYKLPYAHKYEYFNLGAFDEIYSKVIGDVYLIDYGEICKN